MSQQLVLATSLFGGLLVAVAVYLTEGRRHYAPASATSGPRTAVAVRWANDPNVWILAFVAAAVVFGVGTVVLINGATTPLSGALGVLLGAAGAAVLVGYLFYGTFAAARGRGLANAQAAAIGVWVVGLLGIVAVVAALVGLL